MDATLRRRTLIAEDTWELDFGLDGGSVEFAAGQYCRVELPQLEPSKEKTSRKFSLVNPPQEDDHAVVVTRTGVSEYKRALCSLQPGGAARLRKVKGKLVLPRTITRPLAFIAGGIGIAPFVSMLGDLRSRGQLHDVTLLYFNRTAATAAYVPELQRLAEEERGLRLLLSMTREPAWRGSTGRLDAQVLRDLLGEPDRYECYVVGTPAMTAAGVAALRRAGVGADHLHDEDFSGYGRD